MRPYENYRFIEQPDVADIREQGRASHVGKFPGKGGDYRGYCRPAGKRATRRAMKRGDRAKSLHRELKEQDFNEE